MMYFGFRVYQNPHLVTERWVPPKDPFVEFDEKDEWLKKYGFGTMVREPGAMQVGDALYVHPAIYAELSKRIPKVEPKGIVAFQF